MKSSDLLSAIAQMHPPAEWVFASELRVGTGFGGNAEQRIDAWAGHLWPSRRYERRSFEIKVSQSDLKRELDYPEKRQAGLKLSNLFYFVTPPDLFRKFEVPAECGLITVDEKGKTRIEAAAPWRDCGLIDPSFLFSLMRKFGNGGSYGGWGYWTCWCGLRVFQGQTCTRCGRRLLEFRVEE